ncbi:MAG: prolipoprotein diacylglyceryl transferase [Gammaproteobacteria bacterium]|nr:prolipoprotein diacylglyceryl transferase [Gammaproteobacteria bacterium]
MDLLSRLLNNLILSGSSTSWFSEWFYDQSFIRIGEFSIAKYAVCILTGIIVAFFVCTNESKKMGIRRDDILTIMIIAVPFCIILGRIGYMMTDGIPTFKNKIEQYGFFPGVFGGIMSIIGFENAPGDWINYGISGITIIAAIIGVALCIVVACLIKKWKVANFADIVAPGLLIGQAFGRWGNFFNREAYGIVVGGWTLDGSELIPNLTVEAQRAKLLSFGIPEFIVNNMKINGGNYYYGLVDGVQTYGYVSGEQYYHPTFLYESLLNLLGLGFYFIARRCFPKLKSGMIAAGYLIWYGIVRFFIEIIRTDSLYINFFGTPVKNAQVFSVVFILVGIGLMLYLGLSKNKELYKDALKKGEAIVEEEQKNDKDEVVNIEGK